MIRFSVKSRVPDTLTTRPFPVCSLLRKIDKTCITPASITQLLFSASFETCSKANKNNIIDSSCNLPHQTLENQSQTHSKNNIKQCRLSLYKGVTIPIWYASRVNLRHIHGQTLINYSIHDYKVIMNLQKLETNVLFLILL